MKIIILVVLVFVMVFNLSHAQENRCSFENYTRKESNQFSIDLVIVNEDEVGGFQVPFTYKDEKFDLICDSVSFKNSRCGNFDLLEAQVKSEEKTILIMGIYQTNPSISNEPMTPGVGSIATIYFSVFKLPDASNLDKQHLRFVEIDFNLQGTNKLHFTMWDPLGRTINSIYENDVFTYEE